MTIQTARNNRSIRTIARSFGLGLALTATLGGSAHADLKDVESTVNTIKRKVSVIPDNGTVRNLFKKVDPAVVTRLMDVANDTKEVLDTIEAKRAGFDDYKNNGGVQRMRADLKNLFEDLRQLSDTSQQLRCFRDPASPILPMDTQFTSKAVDQMPPVAIFGLQKVLDEAAPDWRTKVSDILDELPIDAVAQMCGTSADIIDRFESARCEVAREMDPIRWARIEMKARTASKIFGVIQEYAPEDVTFTLAVIAVGGGGAGTNVTLPINGILETVINVLDKVETGAAKVLEIQDECEEADEKMERDLLSCMALASYDEQLDDVRDLAVRRLESLDASWDDFVNVQSANSFGELCTSYRDFRMQ